MKNIKKICIFITILIIVNCIIYVYPMYKVLSIYNTEQNNITMSRDINPNYERINDILNSDIDDEYKTDAILMYTDSHIIRNEQRDEFYKILIYVAIILTISAAIIGIIILKLSKNNKYIAVAFITSSIVSLILLILFYTSIYLSRV